MQKTVLKKNNSKEKFWKTLRRNEPPGLRSFPYDEESRGLYRMMDNNTKVLVLDIDGTLTNSRKEISKATNEALQRIMEMNKSHLVIL